MAWIYLQRRDCAHLGLAIAVLQDDNDAGSDSDLSDPGEFQKYGPSNSDEEEEERDENGNLIDKANVLPKGIDTTGVC